MDQVIERFFAKVAWPGHWSACWTWTASARQGYGQFAIQGRPRLAHRVAFEWSRGPIPEGLILDHLCRNTLCVNPLHLEAVTRRENTFRGLNPRIVASREDRCLRGHPFSPENTYVSPSKPTLRRCRTCRRLREAGRRTELRLPGERAS